MISGRDFFRRIESASNKDKGLIQKGGERLTIALKPNDELKSNYILEEGK
jgi:hypothetical protein